MNNKIQFLLYQLTEERRAQMKPRAMAQLFDCSIYNIGLRLKNIFASGELDKATVTEKFSVTVADGQNYLTNFYYQSDKTEKKSVSLSVP